MKSSYAHSFGAMADGSRYVDGFKGIDMRAQLAEVLERGMIQAKALGPTSGGAGGVDTARGGSAGSAGPGGGGATTPGTGTAGHPGRPIQ